MFKFVLSGMFVTLLLVVILSLVPALVRSC